MARRFSGQRRALGLWLIQVLAVGLALGLVAGVGALWIDLTHVPLVDIPENYFIVAGIVWVAVAWVGWIVIRNVDQVLAQDWLDIVAWINQLDDGHWEPLPVPDIGPWGQLGYSLNQMAQRLAAAQSERDLFLASVAHELKTPLTVLHANLEGLATGELGATPERWATLLREVQRLTRLVNELLLIETMQHPSASLNPSYYRLDAQIKDVLMKFEPLAAIRHIALISHVEPLELEADRDHIEQVFTNLIDNALRHTPEGGKISITLQRLAHEVACCVEDTGPGIPTMQHALVTRPFYRDPRSSGVGLGLAVAAALLAAHKGSLTIGNSPLGGAKVCLHLPTQSN